MYNRALKLEEELEKLRTIHKIDEKEKELKTLKDNIKDSMIASLEEGCTKTSYGIYKLNGTVSEKFDSKSFKKDHPKTYEKYCKNSITYKLTENKSKEGEE